MNIIIRKIQIPGAIIINILFSIGLHAQHDSTILSGPYLGQKVPGSDAEIFAPGIISTAANECCASFSIDGNSFLFTRGQSTLDGILLMQKVKSVWSKPELAPFSAGEQDWDCMFSPDSKRVFFSSGRPINDNGMTLKDYRIWVSERTKDAWSEPYLLPYPVNSGDHDSYPSLSEEGTLYFFSRRDGGIGEADIYSSTKINGNYSTIENPGEPVNSEYDDFDPFIAPDESYLIFCSNRPDGFGNYDMYITFKKKKGTWTKPVNMGEKINSASSEYAPILSPDGKFFFFTSNKTGNWDIYWMDSRIIKELKKSR